MGRENKIPAIIWTDTEISSMGFKSKLAEEIAGKNVLLRTIERLFQCKNIEKIILYTLHSKQIPYIKELIKSIYTETEENLIEIIPINAQIPEWFSAIRSARKWALKCWRGGILNCCAFDEEIIPEITIKVFEYTESDLAIIVSSHSPLIDPDITDSLIEQASKHPEYKLFFTQAPPGLCGTIIHKELLDNLSKAAINTGRLIGYDPISPKPDLIDRPCNLRINPNIIKTPIRFIADTKRTLKLIRKLAEKIDLDSAPAKAITETAKTIQKEIEFPPEEIIIELSKELRWEKCIRKFDKEECIPPEHAEDLLKTFASEYDDILVFIAGRGEPTLNENLPSIIRNLKESGAYGIAVRTDGLFSEDIADLLLELPIDIINILLEVPQRNLYKELLGIDGYPSVISNIKRLIEQRRLKGKSIPLIVPEMVKIDKTLELMDEFYDSYFRRLGWAVIREAELH